MALYNVIVVIERSGTITYLSEPKAPWTWVHIFDCVAKKANIQSDHVLPRKTDMLGGHHGFRHPEEPKDNRNQHVQVNYRGD